MKNSISKFVMIAAIAAALWGAAPAQAGPGGGGSDTTTPTPVVEQAVPAKSAIIAAYTCNAGSQTCTTSSAIPAGMRLVVQSVNAYLSTSSWIAIAFSIQPTLNGASLPSQVFFPSWRQMIAGGDVINGVNSLARVYTDSLPPISLTAPAGYEGRIFLNGYLVQK